MASEPIFILGFMQNISIYPQQRRFHMHKLVTALALLPLDMDSTTSYKFYRTIVAASLSCPRSINPRRLCLSNFKFVQIEPSLHETNHTVKLSGLPWEKPKILVTKSHHTCLHERPQLLETIPHTSQVPHALPSQPRHPPIYKTKESDLYTLLHTPLHIV